MKEKKIIKRNGQIESFNKSKIHDAICKALAHTGEDLKLVSGIVENIVNRALEEDMPTVYKIEKIVFEELIKGGLVQTAKVYESYRAVQEFKRRTNTIDDSIMGLVARTNADVMDENSNKDAKVASTQRDLIAGEVSKDITRRKLISTELIQAHDSGAIHIHDMDYMMQPIHNCCLVDIEDMLKNGTVINNKLVETPKSFATACTVMTQIVAQVSSNQYGKQIAVVKPI